MSSFLDDSIEQRYVLETEFDLIHSWCSLRTIVLCAARGDNALCLWVFGVWTMSFTLKDLPAISVFQ
jgi:hypothetical protein